MRKSIGPVLRVFPPPPGTRGRTSGRAFFLLAAGAPPKLASKPTVQKAIQVAKPAAKQVPARLFHHL